MNKIIKIIDTVEKMGEVVVNEAIKQTEITAKELLGDIKPMSDQELAEKKKEEEKKKQEDMANLRKQMGQGRNVEEEMKRIYDEEEREKKQALDAQAKAGQEKNESQPVQPVETVSSNPNKRRKSRGSALMSGKQKKSQPDLQQLTQTGEVKGKVDN